MRYLTLFIFFVSLKIEAQVPSLDSMGGSWVSVDTVQMEPSIRNFRAQALLNKDMSSISWLASVPFSGGYHTGVFRIDREAPMMESFKWDAYQAKRKTHFKDLAILSKVQMVPNENLVMWQIELTNQGSERVHHEVSQDMIGFISNYDNQQWQWWYPYPTLSGATTNRDVEIEKVRDFIGQNIHEQETEIERLIDGKPQKTFEKINWPSDLAILNHNQFRAKTINGDLLVEDLESKKAYTAFRDYSALDSKLDVFHSGGRRSYVIDLDPGQRVQIKFVMAYDQNPEKTLATLPLNFDETWSSVKPKWEEYWTSLFDPESDFLSGTFPVLETEDPVLKQVYYKGPLTLLYLTHLNFDSKEKVFLTGGPRWGASITFFWDITEWSTLWSVVDPQMMKSHLKKWIGINPSLYYGMDNLSGKGVGNGYSANYWALFQMIRSYLVSSGDWDFLNEKVQGKSVIAHLSTYASNGSKLAVNSESELADFGADEWNLLECVPTYKHIVPSFNAGYIWMLREVGKMYEKLGDDKKFKILNQEADGLVKELLELYAGEGVWYSLYPDGEKVEVRHSLDFMFIGRYISKDVPEEIRQEMIDFVYRELRTKSWMRAQSLDDVAAENSDRADHGPLGAFDGWPAGTMDALTQFGYVDKALDFYKDIEPVTHEGIWAQAHELYGVNKENYNADVRIAERGWHNRESSSGIAMSQVMLKDFFGFNPSVENRPISKDMKARIEASLHHVYYQGAYYTLELSNGTTKMIKE